jgi:voltage-gated potassium channel Kch
VQKLSLRQKLRYHFDNVMARGAPAQVGMLFLLSALLVVVTALLLASLAPPEVDGQPESFGHMLWRSLMHTIDPGSLGGDNGTWTFLFIMLFGTMGGIFVVSAFIGILNASLGERLANLRKGRSLVAETGHTVILGFTPKIHTLLHELAEANANQPHACVVVLAEKDKVFMDDEIRARLHRKLKVVTRSGSPTSVVDLGIVNLPAAKSVIVLSPEHDEDGEPMAPHESDTIVLKTLLAVQRSSKHIGEHYHVVAELQDAKILAVARMVVGEKAALLLGPPLISRLLVQTGRQSGLSAVFTELLDFGGCEIYIQPEPALTGKTFREALTAYDDSALMGVLSGEHQLLLPPPFDYKLRADDQVIAISEDDDTVLVNGKPWKVDEKAVAIDPPPFVKQPERTLILGTSERMPLVLRDLAPYCAAGSTTVIVGENDQLGAEAVADGKKDLGHLGISFHHGDITERKLLDELDVTSFDHILVLSESAGRSVDVADARTMVTLFHLRDLNRLAGKNTSITSEMLDLSNRELAQAAEADDFIVSNMLVALMVSQLSENRHLVQVFDELFTYGGHDIRIKPAAHYVKTGVETDFYTVMDVAAKRGEIAIGYRLGGQAQTPPGFGVVVNPTKHKRLAFSADDQIVVLTKVE